MNCSKAEDFSHGDLVMIDDEPDFGTVLGLSCRNEVYVQLGGKVKARDPATLKIIGWNRTPDAEIKCLFCYDVREWVQYFVRFWLPPIAMGLAFAYSAQAIFGG